MRFSKQGYRYRDYEPALVDEDYGKNNNNMRTGSLLFLE
jgi:hypothetical protein